MAIVSTGITGLDAQLGGGVPTGSTILLLSEPSNAPHVFCEHFVVGGLVAGETVFYYNLERPKADVVEGLKRLLPRQDVLKALQYFDLYAVKLRKLGAANLKRLGVQNHAVKLNDDVLVRALKHGKGKPFRIVIESLTQAIEAYGLEPTLAMVEGLSGIAKTLGGVVLVMLVKGMHDVALETRLRHLADGVLEFGLERQGFGLYTYLMVTKMRGVDDHVRLMLYKETDKGLWLESTRRVF